MSVIIYYDINKPEVVSGYSAQWICQHSTCPKLHENRMQLGVTGSLYLQAHFFLPLFSV